MKNIDTRTAIAMQEHAAWKSACSRTHYDLTIEHGWSVQFTVAVQEEVRGLYNLARYYAHCARYLSGFEP